MRKYVAHIVLAGATIIGGAAFSTATSHAEGDPVEAPTTTVSCLVDTCRPPVAVTAPVDHPDTLPAFQRSPDRGVIVPDPNVGAVQTTVAAAPARVVAAPVPARLPTTGGTSLPVVLAAAVTLAAGLLATTLARRGRASHRLAARQR